MSTIQPWKTPVDDRETFFDHNALGLSLKCDGRRIEVSFTNEGGTDFGVAVDEANGRRSLNIECGSGRLKGVTLMAYGKNGGEVNTLRSAFRWLADSLDRACDGKSEPTHDYDDHIRNTKGAADGVFDEARCQTYDSLSEAELMLRSKFGDGNYTAADAVAMADLLAKRVATIEKRHVSP